MFTYGWLAAWRARIAVMLLCFSSLARAAIPAGERAVLDALYAQTSGAGWLDHTNWQGAAGTECTWHGIVCDAGATHVIGISLGFNALAGKLPNLSGLSKLQDLNVWGNQLGGFFPSLTGLADLQSVNLDQNQFWGPLPSLSGLQNLWYFSAESNHFGGSIPALTGLAKLQIFDVQDNQLSGSIPALTDLTGLRNFYVANNGLSGDVPDPPSPSSLHSSGSGLCPNPLNPRSSAAWDAASAGTPGGHWYNSCYASISQLTVTTDAAQVAMGTALTIKLNVSVIGNSADAAGYAMVFDATGAPVCNFAVLKSVGACTVVIADGKYDFTLLYSGDWHDIRNSYSLDYNIHYPGSTSFGVTAASNVAAGNLDQHGWTGSWYNSATSGQGIVMEVYPDVAGAGSGLLVGGWYTFDLAGGASDASGQRWYTLSGSVSNSSPRANLTIYANTGGNFNAAPVTKAKIVGNATLSFTDCMHGVLSYSFTDAATTNGKVRVGSIPLTRLTANVTCAAAGDSGQAAGNYLLSGAWYDPSTSGQGILFDINPLTNGGILAGGWYTFAPNGSSIGGAASQRWFTLQAAILPGAVSVDNVPIYATTGGGFDNPTPTTTMQVGKAKISIQSCNSMTLDYDFSAGSSSGSKGSINLQRAGPTPAGCGL